MTAALTPTREQPARASVLREPAAAPAARVYDAVKLYGRGENEVRALDGVTVEFGSGLRTWAKRPLRRVTTAMTAWLGLLVGPSRDVAG